MMHVRDEEHVQEAVQDRHVNRDQEHDKLDEEQLERPQEIDFQFFREWLSADFLFSNVGRVSGFFAQTAGSLEKDSRCVCFWDGEDHQGVNESGEDKLDPV